MRGSLWTMGGYAASQALRLGSNLFLTRLLFPEVFGELALVSIFVQGLQMFSDIGTAPAIIQSPRGEDERFLNTAWTLHCARGLLLWFASWAIAWPVAALYGAPALRWLIPAAGFNAVLSGFESTALQTNQRQLSLRRLTILDLSSQIVSIAAMVLLALGDRWLYGPNDPNAPWVVIIGGLLSSTFHLVMSHTYLPGIRNRFDLEPEALKHLFHFGRWIFVSTLLTFFASQADRLILGKMVPLSLLGVYSIGLTLASLPTEAAIKLGGAVIFPAYCRLVLRPDFGELYWRVRLPLLLVGAAMVSGLLAAGPYLVGIMYDPRYAAAGWILQYLAAASWFRMLEVTNGVALLAKGRVQWLAAGNTAKVVGIVAMLPLGYHLGGFPGALAGLAAADLFKYLASATGTALAGLRGMRRDILLTGAVAATSSAGFAAGVAVRSGGAVIALLASSVVATSLWTVAAFRHVRRERALFSPRQGQPTSVEG